MYLFCVCFAKFVRLRGKFRGTSTFSGYFKKSASVVLLFLVMPLAHADGKGLLGTQCPRSSSGVQEPAPPTGDRELVAHAGGKTRPREALFLRGQTSYQELSPPYLR